MLVRFLKLRTQVLALVHRHRGGIVVAVSGGCDSMALLALLAELRQEVDFALAVWHVNFGLRGAEAEGDQQHVQTEAKARGLPCHVYRPTAADLAQRRGRSLQEWARLLRQRELRHYCATHDCVAALAHHRDDLAETALYRLIRGVNAAQLPGMVRFNAPFWRPLLTVSKACLHSFCVRRGIVYRIDSSNEENNYARNRIRNLVMPQLTALHHDAAAHVVAVCEQAQALHAEMERELCRRWTKELQQGELDLAALRALPTCKASILLRIFLGDVSQQTVATVLARVSEEGRFTQQLRRGQRVAGEGRKLRLQACVDGVKLARRQQFREIVRQTRLHFILEAGASAETADGLRVQAETEVRQRSVCYHLHRPTQREKVSWRGKRVPRREVHLPHVAYVCTDAAGKQRLLDEQGGCVV